MFAPACVTLEARENSCEARSCTLWLLSKAIGGGGGGRRIPAVGRGERHPAAKVGDSITLQCNHSERQKREPWTCAGSVDHIANKYESTHTYGRTAVVEGEHREHEPTSYHLHNVLHYPAVVRD